MPRQLRERGVDPGVGGEVTGLAGAKQDRPGQRAQLALPLHRKMLAPRQDPKSKRPAITSSGLGAFIGFACPAFMRYDYLLGRQNCRDFLFKEFALGERNYKVFGPAVENDSPWTGPQRQQFAQGTLPGFLPIIPLTGTAAFTRSSSLLTPEYRKLFRPA